MTIAGMATLVLAAGAGTRFGGGKQLAPIAGRPVLARVLDALAGVGDPRVVVLGARADQVRRVVPVDWTCVTAADWAEGPGASLRAGLAAAPAATAALIVLGDLAWLRRAAVERVLAVAAAAPGAAVVRAVEGDRPGHPLLVRGPLLERGRAAPDAGLKPLLEGTEVKLVECTGLGVAVDVDTVADLSRLGGGVAEPE